eukprot:CAMPEP_0119367466 /NCGR_PEP_ID=MMETSP1334-20130426/14250_1 /TAXON_ID=127549 /ORGANISM="Calcidiscus leptoporus, Strain RCC1130" /LENGTH=180 /DNA_ID=CAMNT_0007383875 /DNA_START=174 /DNA_END=716 /DNA_ORIENTATION=+
MGACASMFAMGICAAAASSSALMQMLTPQLPSTPPAAPLPVVSVVCAPVSSTPQRAVGPPVASSAGATPLAPSASSLPASSAHAPRTPRTSDGGRRGDEEGSAQPTRSMGEGGRHLSIDSKRESLLPVSSASEARHLARPRRVGSRQLLLLLYVVSLHVLLLASQWSCWVTSSARTALLH